MSLTTRIAAGREPVACASFIAGEAVPGYEGWRHQRCRTCGLTRADHVPQSPFTRRALAGELPAKDATR